MQRNVISRTTDAIILPTIRCLSPPNLYAAVFELMKLMPAKYIFDRAEEEGILKKGSKVIESSSGTFGLALAMLCAERGYELTLISDPVIDEPLRRRLEDLNAKIVIVDKPAKRGGIQQARLNKLYEFKKKYPTSFWPQQYDNTDNPGGYAPLAKLLSETIGRIDYLVASVGSGGSSGGTYTYLKQVMPKLQLVAVDSLYSVIFGRPDGKRYLRGLGGSLMPKNVNHSLYSQVHWVTDAEGFLATRQLHQHHQLYMGPTSGAVFMVARWLAKKERKAKVVGIFADMGHRYELTVYSDPWLAENNLNISCLPLQPKLVHHPKDAGPTWTYIYWKNKTYVEMMNKPFKNNI